MIRFDAAIAYTNLHGTDMCGVEGYTQQLNQPPGDVTDYIMGESRIEVSSCRYRIRNPKLVWPNWGVSSGDSSPPNGITMKAALEVGAAWHAFKFGGNDTLAVAAGDNGVTDALGFDIPENTLFRPRLAIQVPDTSGWFYDGNGSGARYSNRNLSQSETYAAGAFVGSGGGLLSYGFTPVQIIGDLPAGAKSIGIIGDSIGQGGYSGRDNGFIRQGIRNVNGGAYPSVNYSRSFEYLQSFVNASGAKRTALLNKHTHGVLQLGTNDLSSAFTFNTMRNWYLTAFAAIKAQCGYVAMCTLLPRSQGDGVTPLNANFAAGGVKDQLNDWFYTQIGVTLDAVIPSGETCQKVGDRSRWDDSGAALTSDFTHPNAIGEARMNVPVTIWANSI